MATIKKEFWADVAQLIQLVTHSIYSNKDVFLRELLSNASDAIQKAKMFAAQQSDYLWDELDLHIIVDVDEEKKILTITDTWIWMSREDIIEHLWTIAKSWTKAFLEKMKQTKDAQTWSLIGQFWIWFYSAFMVAKTVEVESKAPWSEAVLRSSDGSWTYEIKNSKKKSRWTVIRLYLSDDADEYLKRDRLTSLITRHSNYVPVPIMMFEMNEDKKTKKLEQINAMKSIRTKQKSEVSQDEYLGFYKALTFDQSEPLDTIHISIEWMVNFKALLFIPKNPPVFWYIDPEQDYGPSLYTQNVMIMERCKDLLPVRLRFVRWVVETPDLPLNVSRELIQSSAVLQKIQKTLIKEIIKSLRFVMKEHRDQYSDFFSHYARYIKEWVHYDFEHKEDIWSLLLYSSWKHKKTLSLDEIIDNLPVSEEAKEKTDTNQDTTNEQDQQEETPTSSKKYLYYLLWQTMAQLQASPYLEQFQDTDHDVILMDDPIDERVVQAMQSYKWRDFVSVMHATDVSSQQNDQQDNTIDKKSWDDFLTHAQSVLPQDRIENVIVSSKLKDSLSILVTKEWAASAQMERIMQSMGHDIPQQKKTLELNAHHPLVQKMLALFNKKWSQDTTNELILYAYQQAIFLEWWTVDDMHWFLQRINKLLTQ